MKKMEYALANIINTILMKIIVIYAILNLKNVKKKLMLLI